MEKTVNLANATETDQLGAALGSCLSAACVIYFQGELGAGKTAMIRAILRALGITGAVKSPSYTLVETYETHLGLLYHFDLYRLTSPDELEWLGFRDYFDGQAICLLEWPEHGAGFLPEADLICELHYAALGRHITIRANTAKGEELLARLPV